MNSTVLEIALAIALAAVAPSAYRRAGWLGLWLGWGLVVTLVMFAYAKYGFDLFGFSHRYPTESFAIAGGVVVTALAHLLFRLRVNSVVSIVLIAVGLAVVLASHMVIFEPLFTTGLPMNLA